MVRKFRLVNEKGQDFSLMDLYNYCFLSNPDGLGYNYETEYQELINTFIENIRRLAQVQIKGPANFVKCDI